MKTVNLFRFVTLLIVSHIIYGGGQEEKSEEVWV